MAEESFMNKLKEKAKKAAKKYGFIAAAALLPGVNASAENVQQDDKTAAAKVINQENRQDSLQQDNSSYAKMMQMLGDLQSTIAQKEAAGEDATKLKQLFTEYSSKLLDVQKNKLEEVKSKAGIGKTAETQTFSLRGMAPQDLETYNSIITAVRLDNPKDFNNAGRIAQSMMMQLDGKTSEEKREEVGKYFGERGIQVDYEKGRVSKQVDGKNYVSSFRAPPQPSNNHSR